MRDLIKKETLEHNMRVHRGVSEAEFNALKKSNDFKNFISTSFDSASAGYFAADAAQVNPSGKKFTVQILAPKWTQAVYIDSKGAYADELELILNVGQKYRILEVKETELLLEVVKRGKTGTIKK